MRLGSSVGHGPLPAEAGRRESRRSTPCTPTAPSLAITEGDVSAPSAWKRRCRLCLKQERAHQLRGYVWMTDSGGHGAVIGSACLCTTFQAPASGRKTVVTLTDTGTISSAPPTRAR